MANRQRQRTAEEMEKDSVLVVEGRVRNIQVINVERNLVPNSAPVEITQFEATIDVTRVLKGTLGARQIDSHQITARFQNTDDSRYKGDKGPKIDEGKHYLFYAEVIGKDKSGEPVLYLTNQNNVDPPTKIPGQKDSPNFSPVSSPTIAIPPATSTSVIPPVAKPLITGSSSPLLQVPPVDLAISTEKGALLSRALLVLLAAITFVIICCVVYWQHRR